MAAVYLKFARKHKKIILFFSLLFIFTGLSFGFLALANDVIKSERWQIEEPQAEIKKKNIIPTKANEIIKLRDKFSKHYKNSDGSITAEISITPVHYKENDNLWRDIDLTITPSDDPDYEYMNTTNNFKTYFSTDPFNESKNIKYQVEDAWVKFNTLSSVKIEEDGKVKTDDFNNLKQDFRKKRTKKFLGIFSFYSATEEQLGQVVENKENKFHYPKVIDSDLQKIDIDYSISRKKILEEIVIDEYWPVKEIIQEMEVYKVDPKIEDRQINFYHQETKKLLWFVPEPVMYELNNPDESNHGLHYEIERIQDGKYLIKKVIDEEGKSWLKNKSLEYPLVIDATFSEDNPTEDGKAEKITEEMDTYYSTDDNDPYIEMNCTSDMFYAETTRGYVEWPISSIDDSSDITDVDFLYRGKSNTDDCHVHECKGQRPSTASAQNLYNELGEGTVYNSPAGFPETGTDKTLDLGSSADSDLASQLSSDWFAIGIQLDSETNRKNAGIYSEENGSASPTPTLVVTYNNPPDVPTSLAQYKSNCSTSLATDGWTSETTVCFKGAISDDDSSDQVKLQVEYTTSSFGNTPDITSSSYCSDPCTNSVSATGLSTGSQYKWQARSIDDDSATSNWSQFDSGTTAFGVDTSAPSTCAVSSIDEASAYAYSSGTTVYYNTASSGNFTVNASAVDSQSGIEKVNFPATVSAGGDDTTSAYSLQYTWATNDTFSDSANITCYNNAGGTDTGSFTVTRDVTDPSGGSVTYVDGYATSTTVAITAGDGSDAGAGLDTSSRAMERQSATISSGSCGAYGEWSDVTGSLGGSYPNYTDATVEAGNCYKYRYKVSDKVSNEATYTSENEAKINDDPGSFSAGPSDGGSTGSSPTNVSSNVTFTGTVSDDENDDWKLLICSTSSAPTASSSVPTCAGGAANLWCIDSSWQSSGSESSCVYAAQAEDDESNNWWAFACDNNASLPSCSSSGQGEGDNGSPFKINHSPAFSEIADDGPKVCGETITFSSTASDADTDTSADTVSLVVCKTEGVSGTACDGGAGDTWATSSATSSNPTATTTVPLGLGSQNYYAYIFDSHNFGSADNSRSSTFTISNATPTVSSVSINSDAASIDLTTGGTTTVTITATVTDVNGCGDIATTTAKFYRSGEGDACSADENNCYTATCSQDGESCSGAEDTSATYTCTADVWYYADPTDSGDHSAENWVAKVTSQDVAASSHSDTDTIEINSLLAISLSESAIAYGSLDLGETSSQATTTFTNLGNVNADIKIYGQDMNCDTGTITAGQQEYATSSDFGYGAGVDLTTSSTTLDVDLPQRTGDEISDYIYWKLQVPATGLKGSCSGFNSFIATNP